jgi:hypothetical protein
LAAQNLELCPHVFPVYSQAGVISIKDANMQTSELNAYITLKLSYGDKCQLTQHKHMTVSIPFLNIT